MKPLVSVVIPSYNHSRYVLTAAHSVLNQTLQNLELIAIDDGSRDDSVALLHSIHDQRMRVVVQENRGAHAAIDRGLRLAQGQYLTVLNSDDSFAPTRLEKALAAFSNDPHLALVGSYIEVIDAEGQQLGVKEGFYNLDPWPVPDPTTTFKADNDLRTALLMQNYWSTTSNFVFPRAIYEQFGPFRPLRYVHDWDFALRVLRERAALLISESLLQYRVHSTNTINSDQAGMVFEICWALAVHLPRYMQTPWFWQAGDAHRVQQLGNSVFLYGCDTVFWKMLSYIQSGTPHAEDALLMHDNPVRAMFLEEIRATLATQRTANDTPKPMDLPAENRLAKLLRRFRQ